MDGGIGRQVVTAVEHVRTVALGLDARRDIVEGVLGHEVVQVQVAHVDIRVVTDVPVIQPEIIRPARVARPLHPVAQRPLEYRDRGARRGIGEVLQRLLAVVCLVRPDAVLQRILVRSLDGLIIRGGVRPQDVRDIKQREQAVALRVLALRVDRRRVVPVSDGIIVRLEPLEYPDLREVEPEIGDVAGLQVVQARMRVLRADIVVDLALDAGVRRERPGIDGREVLEQHREMVRGLPARQRVLQRVRVLPCEDQGSLRLDVGRAVELPSVPAERDLPLVPDLPAAVLLQVQLAPVRFLDERRQRRGWRVRPRIERHVPRLQLAGDVVERRLYAVEGCL